MSDNVFDTDVLIIGAGLAGIGSACHLRRNDPNTNFIILESRAASGGTWDLFKYPGIRSDSDMYTYAYGFKPWKSKVSIAGGDKILSYIRDTAKEYDLDKHIRFQHKVVTAEWSSERKLWSVSIMRGDTGKTVIINCQFILSCCGYYDYEQGHKPHFDDIDSFTGEVVYPQHWPENLVYKDKNVVVVGSGATAVTLVPTMSKETASLVMLQRSPTYIANIPAEDSTAKFLRQYTSDNIAFRVTRWKKVLFQRFIYGLSRTNPKLLSNYLLKQMRKELGDDYDIDTHFTPKYNPWDQRLCAVPDGDMFKSIRDGDAEVVTDQINKFTKNGIVLDSGKELLADIVVMATGLKIKFGGGINYIVDGESIDMSQQHVFRGMMISNIPNMAFTVGYTNSSWTLKTDLTAKYFCNILKKMNRNGYRSVTPRLKSKVADSPMLDFQAGYVLRAKDQLPKNGDSIPWKTHDDYIKDFSDMLFNRLNDEELEFD
jgi:cation diffusion facilitator CzcD-associated flavoprotein CzcO